MTKMEDDQNGRRPKWKKTKMEDDQNGRRPKWKTTKMEDDQKERRPKWKTTKNEDNQNGRHPKWKKCMCCLTLNATKFLNLNVIFTTKTSTLGGKPVLLFW